MYKQFRSVAESGCGPWSKGSLALARFAKASFGVLLPNDATKTYEGYLYRYVIPVVAAPG